MGRISVSCRGRIEEEEHFLRSQVLQQVGGTRIGGLWSRLLTICLSRVSFDLSVPRLLVPRLLVSRVSFRVSFGEKGGVENFNGLVRQYYPKGSDFRSIDTEKLAGVERELNERPREILGFLRPLDYEHKLAA